MDHNQQDFIEYLGNQNESNAEDGSYSMLLSPIFNQSNITARSSERSKSSKRQRGSERLKRRSLLLDGHEEDIKESQVFSPLLNSNDGKKKWLDASVMSLGLGSLKSQELSSESNLEKSHDLSYADSHEEEKLDNDDSITSSLLSKSINSSIEDSMEEDKGQDEREEVRQKARMLLEKVEEVETSRRESIEWNVDESVFANSKEEPEQEVNAKRDSVSSKKSMDRPENELTPINPLDHQQLMAETNEEENIEVRESVVEESFHSTTSEFENSINEEDLSKTMKNQTDELEPVVSIVNNSSEKSDFSTKDRLLAASKVTQSPLDAQVLSSPPEEHPTTKTPSKEESLSPIQDLNSSTLSQSMMKIHGLTPKLKRLRAKMIATSHDARESLSNSKDHSLQNILLDTKNDDSLSLSQTPAAVQKLRSRLSLQNDNVQKELSFQSPPMPGSTNSKTPKSILKTGSGDDRLSLTPALKAFRAKMMQSTPSPLSSQKSSLSAFTSPSIVRPSISTLSTNSSRSKRVMFEEDDSYLESDLSSAKKNLNQQSNALVEKLRGAARQRMMDIQRSRDSLAKKEHLRNEQLAELLETSCETDTEEEQTQETKIVDSHVVQKRKPTVPISPKLGMRRDVSKITSIHKKAETIVEEASTNLNRKNAPKVKSTKPLTVPKSPLLGARRKTNKQPPPKSVESKRSKSPSVSTLSRSPMGLEFLHNTPMYKRGIGSGEENMAPFTLHTAIRAKERSKFETTRAINEKERKNELKVERERVLKQHYKELNRLKDKI
ncbi:predicted protein [Chaetoceros tenuissimus]|uniref:Uncharacterized protein n=1 Tax=Chaetoceros tenuissimus TaxID=426638 RepID=A0AAD3CIS1_9STRA|nr:predicted protein [Chaetoceros tenuissimus]